MKTPGRFELDPAAVIAAGLIVEATPHLRRDFSPDCCIAAARLALQVIRPLGLKAEAVAVRVIIQSPALTRRYMKSIEQTGGPPTSDQVNAWMDAHDLTKCWTLLLGASDDEAARLDPRLQQPADERGKWAGHLAVLIEGRVLLDLTLPQANRPKFGIVLEPTAVKVGPDFLAGAHVHRTVNESLCQWTRSEARGWETAPDWREKHRTRELAKEVRRAIERRVRHADR